MITYLNLKFRRKREKQTKIEQPLEQEINDKIEKKIKTEDEIIDQGPSTTTPIPIIINTNNIPQTIPLFQEPILNEDNSSKLMEQFRKLEEEINKIQVENENPMNIETQQPLQQQTEGINLNVPNENEEKNKEEGELDIKKNENFVESDHKNAESLKKRGSASSEKKKNKKKDKKSHKKKDRKSKKKDRKRSRSRKNRKSYDSDSSD